MGYTVNPICLSSVFTLPSTVADRHLKLANPEHIKVLIYIFRNLAEGIIIEKIADATGVSEYDINEALLYWADAGILLPDRTNTINKTDDKPKSQKKSEKPSRVDVAKRGLEDERIRYLMNETQIKFGRNLKTNETSTLIWLYDDLGLDVSLIMLIIQYAVNHNKANIRFIEQIATEWVDNGIDNISDAEEDLRIRAEDDLLWKKVSICFGIERRKPSKKELELSRLWITDWKISNEMLTLAYEECVDKKSKFSFPYVAKIIENWHNDGITSPEDITSKKEKKDDGFGVFDLDLYEKMINSKD